MNIDQRHEKVPPGWVNSQWGRIYHEPRKLLSFKIIFSASLALMKWGDEGGSRWSPGLGWSQDGPSTWVHPEHRKVSPPI